MLKLISLGLIYLQLVRDYCIIYYTACSILFLSINHYPYIQSYCEAIYHPLLSCVYYIT